MIKLKSLITQYAVYLGGKLMVAYDTEEEANEASEFAFKETGIPHEVRLIRQAPKEDIYG